LHKLMCIVLSAVMIALCRAIRVVCLHDVSMIAIGVEGTDQDEEEPSHHHVAPGMSLPHEPSQITPGQSTQRVQGKQGLISSRTRAFNGLIAIKDEFLGMFVLPVKRGRWLPMRASCGVACAHLRRNSTTTVSFARSSNCTAGSVHKVWV
jgi:hypothetical protein